MWFATNGGVSRYEAGVFTNYTVANGLSDNSVWSMMLDKSGTIWVGTPEDVCQQITGYAQEVGGFDTASHQVNFHLIPATDAATSMRLFAQEVIPAL